MIIVKARIWRILYYLLKKNDIVTASELASFVNVSIRTIKSDMVEVKELATSGGCEIITEKANGYRAKIVNEDLYLPMKSILIMNFSEAEYSDDMGNKANNIARHLLLQDDWIKEEELADLLYVSISTIKSNMKDVKEIFCGFNLKLNIRPNYGLLVEGLEINKRFCMLELLIKHHYKAISLINYPEFESLFVIDEYQLERIRRIFLKKLRDSGIHIIDPNSHRLLRYIALTYKRLSHNHKVVVDDDIVKKCNKLKEYELSKQVIDALHEELNLPLLDEYELCGITILLLYWNDITNHNEIKKNYGEEIYNLASLYSETVFESIYNKWGIYLSHTKESHSLLIAQFVPYAYRTIFKQIGYRKYLGRIISSNDIAVSPLCLSFAKCAMFELEKKYDVQTNNYFIFELATRLHYMLQLIEIPYKKRNLLICMRNGIDSGNVTKQILFDTFGKDSFDKIKMLEFYEIRGVNQNEYDCCLLNSDIYYYRNYDVPAVICNTIPTLEQREEIRTKVIQEGYQYDQLFNELGFNEELKINDLKIQNREEFIRLIKYRFSLKDEDELSFILSFDELFVYEEVVTIVVPKDKIGQSLFEINRLSRPCDWCGRNVNCIIFISVDLRNNLIGTRLLQKILYMLITDKEFINTLNNDSCYGNLIEQLKISRI